MDVYSLKSSRLRRAGKILQLKKVNVKTGRSLLGTGKRLFKILKRVKNVPHVSTFKDLFGEEFELTLELDEQTRKFPWELAYDGEFFLFNRYDVGRVVLNPPISRYSGIDPEHRTALVVGLSYAWMPNHRQLETSEREALQVARQLKKKGYSVTILRGKEATKQEVERILSTGVSIFHFSGHGTYKAHQPEGRKGSLLLSDEELTENDLKKCFEKAKGAPFLSFLNACESAKEIYSSHLIDAFVEYGAECVIGTFWSIYDSPSTRFASRFYREAASGQTFAHALQLARWQFFDKRRFEEAATWPAFVLYGSPSTWLKRAP